MRLRWYLFLHMFFFMLFLWACQEKKSDITHKEGVFAPEGQSSCVGCHTDKALLAEVAEPLEDTGGEAGEG